MSDTDVSPEEDRHVLLGRLIDAATDLSQLAAKDRKELKEALDVLEGIQCCDLSNDFGEMEGTGATGVSCYDMVRDLLKKHGRSHGDL